MLTHREQGRRYALIAGAIFMGIVALLFLGGALPDIDGTSGVVERRVYGVIFALLATCSLLCFHLVQRTSKRRIVVELAVVFVVLVGVGLMFNL